MLLVTDLPHNQGRQFDIAELQPSSEIHPQFTGFLTVATTKIYLFPDASKKKKKLLILRSLQHFIHLKTFLKSI